jgi:hypothetical protein
MSQVQRAAGQSACFRGCAAWVGCCGIEMLPPEWGPARRRPVRSLDRRLDGCRAARSKPTRATRCRGEAEYVGLAGLWQLRHICMRPPGRHRLDRGANASTAACERGSALRFLRKLLLKRNVVFRHAPLALRAHGIDGPHEIIQWKRIEDPFTPAFHARANVEQAIARPRHRVLFLAADVEACDGSAGSGRSHRCSL